MPISGTGTGPFTITGTETTLSIFNAVVAANAANATKNSDNTSFDFNCILLVGDGTTATSWTSSEEMVRIDATSFQIRANATLNIGLSGPARAGSYWRWQMTGPDQIVVNGTLNVYASRLYMSHRAVANNGATCYFEECTLALLDSLTNGEGSQNPTISYVRCFLAGAWAVAVKLGGSITYTGSKISGAAHAFQPLGRNSASTTYTVSDVVGSGNANDVLPNTPLSGTLNVVGMFNANGTARTSLTVFNPHPSTTVRLQWRYNLSAVFSGAGISGARVRIRNTNGTDVYTGSTDANSAIPQQILTRMEYIGSTTATNRFPYNIRVRAYNRSSEDLTYNADNHASQTTVHAAVPFLTLTEAQAAALTGIALVASGATGGTVTISGNRTVADVWQFYRQWIATIANFDSEDTWTYDGTTLNMGAWNVVVNAGVTLTGNLATTGTVTNNGTVAGSYTDASGTRVTIRSSDGLALTTRILVNGVDQGQTVEQTSRNLFVGPTTPVRIFAIAYGYQPKIINVTGNKPADYVISLVPETNVDTTLDATTRDTIVSAFATGIDAQSRIFLSVNADLRQYTPAQVLNALHRFMVVSGGTVAAAALAQDNVNGFWLMRGGFVIRSPGFYGKVADSITAVGNLGILVPLAISVDPSVYGAMPTYAPVEKNTSGIVLQYAPWTQQQADVPTWVAREDTAQAIKSNAGLIPALL